MIDINNYNKVKEFEERINKEGLNKVIEDFMKNPYKDRINFNKNLNI